MPSTSFRELYPFDYKLIDDGWRTPDTYLNDKYGSFPDAPGVYIFVLSEISCVENERRMSKKMVYVGMARNLRKRQQSHEVFAAISSDIRHINKGFSWIYIIRWFRPCESSQLRAEEKRLIRLYDPSYNLIHRKVGLGGSSLSH
jgi:excinuclease UvrABC nuclease subunit